MQFLTNSGVAVAIDVSMAFDKRLGTHSGPVGCLQPGPKLNMGRGGGAQNVTLNLLLFKAPLNLQCIMNWVQTSISVQVSEAFPR